MEQGRLYQEETLLSEIKKTPDKAYVYWIHLENHSDVTQEGYIGVTTNNPVQRFNQHKYNSERPEGGCDSVLRKAFLKYGADNLIQDILVITDKDSAFELEFQLRPTECIGWNIQLGGNKGTISSTFSEEEVLSVLEGYYLKDVPIKTLASSSGISDSHIRGLLKGDFRRNILDNFIINHRISSEKLYTPQKFNYIEDSVVYSLLEDYYTKQLPVEKLCHSYKLSEKSLRYFVRKGTKHFKEYQKISGNTLERVSHRKIDTALEQLILGLYSNSLNALEIKARLGVNEKTVKAVLLRNNVKTRGSPRYKDEDIVSALQLLDETGWSMSKVAEVTGVCRRTIASVISGKSRAHLIELVENTA